MKKTAIIGGGAAGLFLAVNLKEMVGDMEVSVFEKSNKVLSKVAVSGGGRCNCTNTFENVSDLSKVYPRGFRLIKNLFKNFDCKDTFHWFENHGVKLKIQDDGRVFPKSDNSYSVVNCLLSNAERLGVKIYYGKEIQSLQSLSEYDYIVVTTGGMTANSSNFLIKQIQTEIIPPVPSLFAIKTNNSQLHNLSGISVNNCSVSVPCTKFHSYGAVLITHFGFSGPAILKLSSYAARYLYECNYHTPLIINWSGKDYDTTKKGLQQLIYDNPQKQFSNIHLPEIPKQLWEYLLYKAIEERYINKVSSLNNKDINRIVNILCNDVYTIEGKAPYKEEFVTCGGVSLKSINSKTLESKDVKGLYFAGEVLDIDGITGGFNLQSAWTCAFTVAKSIAESCNRKK